MNENMKLSDADAGETTSRPRGQLQSALDVTSLGCDNLAFVDGAHKRQKQKQNSGLLSEEMLRTHTASIGDNDKAAAAVNAKSKPKPGKNEQIKKKAGEVVYDWRILG